MAEVPPSDLEELGEVEGVGPRAVRRWGRGLLSLINHPRRAPERVRPPRPSTPDASERKRLKRMLAARDVKAEELGIQAGLICSRGVAEVVSSSKPSCTTVQDLANAGVEGWRLEVLGEDFLKAIAEE
jgi:ribonuclease D